MKLKTDIGEELGSFSVSAIRNCVESDEKRKLLNKIYQKLSFRKKQQFHKKFSKIFRKANYRGNSSRWKINFAGKSILMPLKKGRMWLDWDSALSILGHEIEIKQTYEALISSKQAPELFIDIGANYGTHSLLFLIHEIETLVFEPNKSCHAVFKEMCAMNNIATQVEGVALGARNGRTRLIYPEKKTWNGSTNVDIAQNFSPEYKVQSDNVKQKKLDAYLPRLKNKRNLIKIDTEGNELAVLKGAQKTLDETKPMLIFESFGEGERQHLYDFLADKDFNIFSLPWYEKKMNFSLNSKSFLADDSSNFIAVKVNPDYSRRNT
ncbi:MAG TPA: FkbM family methyltransferase [Balneolaceae bacterium]|nr:FkbM family methyltransferase [Balneolaceae bacterium]